MPNLSRCSNGHIFDRDVYATCPYCDNLSGIVRRPGNEDDYATRPLPRDPQLSAVPTGGIPTAAASETITPEKTLEPDNKTEIVNEKEHKFVVGWLAVIDGPYQGKSFELHAGYNRVGRNEGDIKLEKDHTISRANHFRIVYDDEDNLFLFFAGDSDNYPRLDGKKKYGGERAELMPYSVIEAGGSKFIFVPLCTNNFQWGGKKSSGQ